MMLSEELLYELWLSVLCKHDPVLIYRCIGKFGTPAEIYGMAKNLIKKHKLKGIRDAVGFDPSMDKAKRLAEECERRGIRMIGISDPDYPKRLFYIDCPPRILYCKGELPPIDDLVCITIVGSRKCPESIRRLTRNIARDLAGAGVLVISGMAIGGDTSAHYGALEAGHKTVAVLAGSVDMIYPKENENLYHRILENGAILSERPPGTVGEGSFYNERNRILAGLSNGTLVVSGSAHSGTRITARWAIESNRDIFVIPGNPTEKMSFVPNDLLLAGATPVVTADDILGTYKVVYEKLLQNGIRMKKAPPQIPEIPPHKPLNEGGAKWEKPVLEKTFEDFEGKNRTVLKYLYDHEGRAHIDEIAAGCDMRIPELNSTLMLLQMKSAVKKEAGGMYVMVNKRK